MNVNMISQMARMHVHMEIIRIALLTRTNGYSIKDIQLRLRNIFKNEMHVAELLFPIS